MALTVGEIERWSADILRDDGQAAKNRGAACFDAPVAGVLASGAGDFGPDPATDPNLTHLATGPAVVPNGPNATSSLGGAHGHSEYPRFSDNGLPRTTGYNIAAVIVGLPDNAKRQ